MDTTTYQKPGIIIIGVQSKTFPKYRKCPTKQPSNLTKFCHGNLLYAFSPAQTDHLLQSSNYHQLWAKIRENWPHLARLRAYAHIWTYWTGLRASAHIWASCGKVMAHLLAPGRAHLAPSLLLLLSFLRTFLWSA